MASITIEYNGVKFRRYPDSKRRSDRIYYRPSSNYIKSGVGYLHEEIWRSEVGPIPEGFHIHHKDGNPDNNSITNLECLPGFTHLSNHAKEFYAGNKEWVKNHLEEIRPLTKEWHRSPEGHEWHSQHGRSAWSTRKPTKRICDHCGKSFEDITRRDGTRFCSNACKSAARRAEGKDLIDRTCEHCGKHFLSDKYRPARFCSRRCSGFRRKKD